MHSQLVLEALTAARTDRAAAALCRRGSEGAQRRALLASARRRERQARAFALDVGFAADRQSASDVSAHAFDAASAARLGPVHAHAARVWERAAAHVWGRVHALEEHRALLAQYREAVAS